MSKNRCIALSLLLAAQAQAQEPPAKPVIPDAWYVAPLASYIAPTDRSDLDAGYGGTLALGYREGFYAIEAAAVLAEMDARNDGDSARLLGGELNALIFPFRSASSLYALIGIGGLEYSQYPTDGGRFSSATVSAGAGYLWPIRWGRYGFALRTEARFRYGRREEGEATNVERVDEDAPNDFKDVLVSIGLYLPGALQAPPEPPPDSVQVVPVAE